MYIAVDLQRECEARIRAPNPFSRLFGAFWNWNPGMGYLSPLSVLDYPYYYYLAGMNKYIICELNPELQLTRRPNIRGAQPLQWPEHVRWWLVLVSYTDAWLRTPTFHSDRFHLKCGVGVSASQLRTLTARSTAFAGRGSDPEYVEKI